jgi:transposase InsO family protein
VAGRVCSHQGAGGAQCGFGKAFIEHGAETLHLDPEKAAARLGERVRDFTGNISGREVVHRTRGSSHGQIARLVSPWGARKIRERLLRRLPHAIKVPASSTIHAVLDRHGLVTRAVRPRTRAEGTPLSGGLGPNDLWCTDYKGEFQLGDKRYCYPLTVTDHASRYLLLCEAMESNRTELAFQAF